MSTVTSPSTVHHEHAAAHAPHQASFLSTYVFSKDHKVIGLQFLFSTLVWFLIGGLLALAAFGGGPWSVDGWIEQRQAEAETAAAKPQRAGAKGVQQAA